MSGSAIFAADLGNGDASDAPVVGVNFVDHDNGSLFVFTKHVMQQIGGAFDQGLLLLRGNIAFTRRA